MYKIFINVYNINEEKNIYNYFNKDFFNNLGSKIKISNKARYNNT